MSVVKYKGLRLDTVGEEINGLTFNQWLKTANAESKIQAEVDPAIAREKEVDLLPLTITDNGTYTAPDGYAYKNVVASVGGVTYDDLEVTENGTYQPQSGHAYKKVTVDVQSFDAEELEVTANGVYEPDTGKAYNKVTVQVPSAKVTYKAAAMELVFENIEMEVT